MKARACLTSAVMLGLFGLTTAANASPYVVTIDQVGADIVTTGSGNIDLTGLTSSADSNFIAAIVPNAVGSFQQRKTAGIFTTVGLRFPRFERGRWCALHRPAW